MRHTHARAQHTRTDRQTDRHTEAHTHTEKHTQRHTHTQRHRQTGPVSPAGASLPLLRLCIQYSSRAGPHRSSWLKRVHKVFNSSAIRPHTHYTHRHITHTHTHHAPIHTHKTTHTPQVQTASFVLNGEIGRAHV